MNSITSPFLPQKYENNIIQKHQLPSLKLKGLNNMVLESLREVQITENDDSSKTIQGISAEIVANYALSELMKSYSKRYPDIETKIIEGRESFIINSSENYIAKLDGGSRIFILRKPNKVHDDDDPKFGFDNIAEIDGLHLIKRKKPVKNERVFMPVEVKSGKPKLKLEHIINDILIPLKEMYQSPINYVLIGFKNELYKGKHNQLKKQIQDLHDGINDYGFNFIPLHFPFTKLEFQTNIGYLQSELFRKYPVTGTYDENTGDLIVNIKNKKLSLNFSDLLK